MLNTQYSIFNAQLITKVQECGHRTLRGTAPTKLNSSTYAGYIIIIITRSVI